MDNDQIAALTDAIRHISVTDGNGGSITVQAGTAPYKVGRAIYLSRDWLFTLLLLGANACTWGLAWWIWRSAG